MTGPSRALPASATAPRRLISSISERSSTSSLPSWRRRVTDVADSLAISPLRTRPLTVATVKAANFDSSARFGSRMATSSDSGDLSLSVARSGPTSTPSFPIRWHEMHSFLKTAAPAARSPLSLQGRPIRLDDRLREPGPVSEHGLGAGAERPDRGRSAAAADAPGRSRPARSASIRWPRAGRRSTRCGSGACRGSPPGSAASDPSSPRGVSSATLGSRRRPRAATAACWIATGTRGPDQADEPPAIFSVARGRMTQEGHGRQPIRLVGRIISDHAPGRLPDAANGRSTSSASGFRPARGRRAAPPGPSIARTHNGPPAPPAGRSIAPRPR